ncbi:hypothetical protein CYMTET_24891 [Cymbomonas tetramitiformis]|uniref:Uncharacterized protein n=1 Tax=Cymbomonas tetramitiformis TaxID=36881 RepID=A0AAE0FVH5_9CHLO|nr:hypothetical protein CYMTET_24891 [Cymbomonas tetramitiformis]
MGADWFVQLHVVLDILHVFIRRKLWMIILYTILTFGFYLVYLFCCCCCRPKRSERSKASLALTSGGRLVYWENSAAGLQQPNTCCCIPGNKSIQSVTSMRYLPVNAITKIEHLYLKDNGLLPCLNFIFKTRHMITLRIHFTKLDASETSFAAITPISRAHVAAPRSACRTLRSGCPQGVGRRPRLQSARFSQSNRSNRSVSDSENHRLSSTPAFRRSKLAAELASRTKGADWALPRPPPGSASPPLGGVSAPLVGCTALLHRLRGAHPVLLELSQRPCWLGDAVFPQRRRWRGRWSCIEAACTFCPCVESEALHAEAGYAQVDRLLASSGASSHSRRSLAHGTASGSVLASNDGYCALTTPAVPPQLTSTRLACYTIPCPQPAPLAMLPTLESSVSRAPVTGHSLESAATVVTSLRLGRCREHGAQIMAPAQPTEGIDRAAQPQRTSMPEL